MIIIIIIMIINIYRVQNTKVSKRYAEKFKLQLTLHHKLQHNTKKI